MYTVVPKKPKGELDRDPYPFLDTQHNWGLTDEEFKLKFGKRIYGTNKETKQLMRDIVRELIWGEDELDTY